ncbi:hypothetical protein VTP01DRAFT_6851, partial [Rhizomucor pusillus]|uniref:uncharacterized protein n=1 Tax=Rhizomucor pusillus TaxID=4840 RepID=UPI00374217A7
MKRNDRHVYTYLLTELCTQLLCSLASFPVLCDLLHALYKSSKDMVASGFSKLSAKIVFIFYGVCAAGQVFFACKCISFYPSKSRPYT